MDADPTPWAALHVGVSALEPERRAAFALACAEHLVRLNSDKPELLGSIADGWAVLAGQARDLTTDLAELDARGDADDDEVACVRHALNAVAHPDADQSPLWASDRAIAAAYEQVPYAENASIFRSLSDDAKSSIVQGELRWQAKTLATFEETTSLSEACRTLRSRLSESDRTT